MASQKSPSCPKFSYNLFLITFFTSILTITSTTTSNYQISCTMCSACHNPCGQTTPPTPPSQPPPSYYNYPPPNQPTYKYYPPPPPQSGGYYYQPPTGYGIYPGPPPPNPIVPYFPFFYHTPPTAPTTSMSGCNHLTPSLCTLLLCAVLSVVTGMCSWKD